jgi:hypothetical protein
MRFAPFALVVGVASAAVLGFSAVGTVSGFSATINNSNNFATTASLIMKETQGSFTCLSTDSTTVSSNSSTCSTINKYGGTATPLVPGGTPVSTTVNIYNTGTVTPSVFTLTPAACSQSTPSATTGSATDLCSNITLVVTCGATNVPVFSGTLTAYNTGGAISIPGKSSSCVPAPGGTTPVPFTFAVSLNGGSGNTYQNLTASQAMSWSFGIGS